MCWFQAFGNMLKDMSGKKKNNREVLPHRLSAWKQQLNVPVPTRKKYPEITKGAGELEMKSSDGENTLLSVLTQTALPVHCKARDQSGVVFDRKVPRRPRKMECINTSLLQWRTNRAKQEESKQRATLSDNVSAGMQTLCIPDHSCRYWRHKRQTLEEEGIHSVSLWNRACTHSLHNHR